MSANDYERLAKKMDQRRADLSLSWDNVAKRGGTSVATLRRVRTGKAGELTIDAKIAIERGLSWAPGSVDAILAGGEPTELTPAAPAKTEVEAGLYLVLNADHRELIVMFRDVERERGASTAEQWLADALDMRDRARRLKETTKRDVP